MAEDQNRIPDVQQGLDQLTNETTAADLIRQHGQHRRLQTVSRSKLIGWMQRAIASELNQALQSREAEISDDEKQRIQEQALASVQEQLQQYKQQSDAAQQRAEDLQSQYEDARQAAEGNQELQEALANLQEQANRAEQRANEQQNDLFELEDRFNENAEMLHATIAEKDRLQNTNRELLMRGTELVQIVLDIDQASYGGRHQREYEDRNIEHEEGKEFYADFDVAAMVIKSLKTDLTKLHKLTYKIEEDVEPAKAELVESNADGTQRYTYDSASTESEARLEKDLDLINHLQMGQFGGKGAIDADQAQLLIRITDACISQIPGGSQDDIEEDEEGAPEVPGDVLQVKLQRLHELFTEQLERNRQLASEINASSEEQSQLQKSKQELEASMEEELERMKELERLAGLGRELPTLQEKLQKLESQLKEERDQHLTADKKREQYQQQVVAATEAEQKLAEAISGFQEVLGEGQPPGGPIAASVEKLQSRLQELPDLTIEDDAAVPPIRPHLFEDIANDGIAVINQISQEAFNRQQKAESLQQDLEQRTEEVRQKDELIEKIGEANRGLIAAVNAIPSDETPGMIPGASTAGAATGEGEDGGGDADQATAPAAATGEAWDELSDFPDADSGDEPEDIDAVLAEEGENDDLVLLDDFDTPESLVATAQEAAERAQANVARLNEQFAQLQAEAEQLRGQLAEKDRELEAKSTELSTKEEEVRAKGEELDGQQRQYQEAEASLIALRDEKAQLEARTGELDRQLADAAADRDRLQVELKGSQERIEELEPQLAEARENIARLEGSSAEERQGREAAERELQGVREELERLKQEKGLIEETLQSKEGEIAQLGDLAAARQEELDTANQRLESLGADKEDLEQRATRAEEQLITLEAMQNNLAEAVAEMARLQAEETEALADEVGQSAEIIQSCSELDQAKESLNQDEDAPQRLAAASQAVLDHLKSQNQRIIAKLNDAQTRLTAAESQRQQLSGEVDELRSTTESQLAKMGNLKQLLKQSRAAIDEVKAREEAASAGLKDELQRLKNERQEEETRSNAERQKLSEQLSAHTEELAQLRQRTEELNNQLESSEQEKNELQTMLDASGQERVEISALQAKLEALEKKNRELIALQEEEVSHSGRVHQLVDEVQQIQEQRNDLKQRLRSVQTELANERSKTEGLAASRDQIRVENEEQIKQLQERLSRAQADIEATRSELQQQLDANAGLEAKVRSLTALDDDEDLDAEA